MSAGELGDGEVEERTVLVEAWDLWGGFGDEVGNEMGVGCADAGDEVGDGFGSARDGGGGGAEIPAEELGGRHLRRGRELLGFVWLGGF